MGVASLLLGAAPAPEVPATETTETIAFVRHGEKPASGLGQLDCQGLNRALALPAVIKRQFGVPAAVFAPDPGERKPDRGKLYNYIRPLATIEPAAIAFGLPVDTSVGQSRVDALRRRLENPALRDAFVLVGWEHREIANVAREIVASLGGDARAVPMWDGNDFDSIYIVRIVRSGRSASVRFEIGHEGLNDQPTACPG